MRYKIRVVNLKDGVRYDIVETKKKGKKIFETLSEAEKYVEFLRCRKKERDLRKLEKEKSIEKEKRKIEEILSLINCEFGVEVRFLNKPISYGDAIKLYYKLKNSDVRNTRI